MSDLCNLASEELAERRQTVISELKQEVELVEETTEGFHLKFPLSTGILRRLADFIDFERVCCSFIDFTLKVPANGRYVILGLRGVSEEGQKFIRSELGEFK